LQRFNVSLAGDVTDKCGLALSMSNGNGIVAKPSGHIYLLYFIERLSSAVPLDNISIWKYDTNDPQGFTNPHLLKNITIESTNYTF